MWYLVEELNGLYSRVDLLARKEIGKTNTRWSGISGGGVFGWLRDG
jgi:hypothetical protein